MFCGPLVWNALNNKDALATVTAAAYATVPVQADVLDLTVVEEEDSDTGQLGDFTGFNGLSRTDLQNPDHGGPVPEPLLPLGKDQRAWEGGWGEPNNQIS